MLVGKPAQPLDRDLSVLVEVEDVLQRDDSLDERPRPPRVEIGGEFERIPQPFAPESNPVVLGRRGVTFDLVGGFAQRPEAIPIRSGPPFAPAAKSGRSGARGGSGACGRNGRRTLVPARVEGIEHRVTGGRTPRLQQGAYCGEGFAVCLGYIREAAVELLRLDVEIADGAERVSDPAEVVLKVRRRGREEIGEQRQGRP